MANKKRNSQKTITRTYHSRIKGMLKGEVEREIFDALSAGKNTYLRYDRLQSSSFDSSWIEMIEGVIFDLGEIIANPRMTTKVEGNIVPVELARKTGAESVQHLSSHTQYIKEIDEYGNVIPSKIMTMVNEDDLHTYENRFIATFVRRLVLFIEKRYEVVSEFAELKNQEVLMFKNKSIVNGAEVEIETKVKVAYKADDENAVKSSNYIKRIQEIRNYVLYFYNSSFMRQLKTERDVRNPILQTNIIRKNPKYHHCYEVYKFIETYDKLGVNYKVDENYSLFNEEEMEELNHTLFANYVTLRGKDISKNHKEIKHIYKPRILTSIDDEVFNYGALLSGPITFVRADQRYQDYLDSKVRKDLPLHPTKREKEYYADEYEAKRQNKEDLKEKEDLLKRKNKEIREFEKLVQRILEEREKARLKLLQLEKELIEKEENERLAAARAALIAASLSDHEEAEKEYQASEEEQKLNELKAQIAATKVIEPTHPSQDPVTYEEAVEQIWPQTKNAPALRAASINEQPVATENKPVNLVKEENEPISAVNLVKEEPKEQAQPVNLVKEEAQPQVINQPVEMSHPYSKPVTYEEAVEEIWPNIKNAPIYRVAPKQEETKVSLNKEEPVSEPVSEQNKQVQPVIVVVPMSHPESEPVTYDEAVAQIWPNIKDAPILRVAPKEEKAVEQPVKQEQPQQIVPAVVPTPMSHPAQDPVTYDEAVEQIWPQTKGVNMMPIKQEAKEAQIAAKKAPAKKAKSAKTTKAKPVVAPTNAEEQKAPQEIKPAVVPVEMSHPAQEPVTYDEAVEQIWPNIKDAPTLRVAPQGEPVQQVEPVKKAPVKRAPRAQKAEKVEEPIKEEKKAPKAKKAKKAPAKKAAPKAKPVKEAPIAPIKEEKPVEEQVKAAPQPAKEEAKVVKPAPTKKATPKAKAPVLKTNKKPTAKPAPKKAQPKPAKPVEQPREKIPGKFIVKTNEGYYVSKNKYSIYKHEAKIFDDFNLANDIKKNYGGKVVKL